MDRSVIIIILTDDGEVDAAVASRRSAKVHAASVESGVGFANVVNGQAGRLLDRGEESSFAQHLLVGPVSRSSGKFIPGVVP